MKRTIQRVPAITLIAVFIFVVLGIMPAMAALTTDAVRSAPAGDGTATVTATNTETATASPSPSATITATETAEPQPTASPTVTGTRQAEVEFRGTVQNVVTGSVTIAGKVVKTDAHTQFEPNAAAVVVGAFVEVEGFVQSDMSILANEINVESAPGGEVEQIEFRGLIQSFNATQWVVAGRTLSITAQTIVSGTPQIGAIAEVKASKLADGTLVAMRIIVRTPENETERVEFKGLISAFGATQWTVGGKTVIVTAQTVISGTPQIGLMAEVNAIKSGTILTATRITVEQPEAAEVDFQGVIASISGNTWVIGGKTVTVSAQTMIDASRGPVKVGATVEVKGTVQAGGSILAGRIQVERAQ